SMCSCYSSCYSLFVLLSFPTRRSSDLDAFCCDQFLSGAYCRCLRYPPWAVVWLWARGLVFALFVAAPHRENWLWSGAGRLDKNLWGLLDYGCIHLGGKLAGCLNSAAWACC